jgi:hypothetical protein
MRKATHFVVLRQKYAHKTIVILIEMTTKNIMPPDLTFGGLWETVVES